MIYNSYDLWEEGDCNWTFDAKFYCYMQKDVHES